MMQRIVLVSVWAAAAACGAPAGEQVETRSSIVPVYLVGCDTMFAARVVEKQIEIDPTFFGNCDAPLVDDIGNLNMAGDPLCVTGETANQCLERVYDTPPDPLTVLDPGCMPGAANCMFGKWAPKCADGTDTNCTVPEAVCTDGTRPMVHIEPANPGPSNKWVFRLGGEGGPCAGDRCWVNYRYLGEFGEVVTPKAMSTLHPDYRTLGTIAGSGVVSGLPAGGANPFANYNRVRFERCSDVASDANESVRVPDGVPAAMVPLLPNGGVLPGGGMLPVEVFHSTVTAHHRALAIWKAAYHMLDVAGGTDLDGDMIADVPSLADAEVILNTYSSDSVAWGIFAADRLTNEAQLIAPEVSVHLAVDGFFQPMLDNEGRYSPGAPVPFDIFTNSYSATALCGPLPNNGDGIANELCSDANYLPGQPPPTVETTVFHRSSMEARGTVLDESCETFHGAGAPICYDHLHTLLNHVATPFAVIADQEDSVVSGVPALYSNPPTYTWATPVPYRARVLDSFRDVRDFWSTAARSEEGPGVAGNAMLMLRKSHRNGQPWSTALHTHFDVDARMRLQMSWCTPGGVRLGGISIALGLDRWIAGTLPALYMAEDGPAWNGMTNYWYTGAGCGVPQ